MKVKNHHLMHYSTPWGGALPRRVLAGGALAAVLFLTVMTGLHVHSLDEDQAGAAGGCHLCLQLDHLGMDTVGSAPHFVMGAEKCALVCCFCPAPEPLLADGDPARAPPSFS